LDDISIDFPQNQIHGIVGLNGAGKTTFFNVLSTTLKAQTGSLKFNENSITNSDIAYLETVNYFVTIHPLKV
jgi:ABC-type multidrug transport system ATPase subunit